jgi:L-ascorbate metabolism protein UlaG (beta-lactamase superfamily)
MKKINPEMVIPVHFSPEKRRNAEGLKEKLNREGIACRILEVGEELQID